MILLVFVSLMAFPCHFVSSHINGEWITLQFNSLNQCFGRHSAEIIEKTAQLTTRKGSDFMSSELPTVGKRLHMPYFVLTADLSK